jgi:hypothetical protein
MTLEAVIGFLFGAFLVAWGVLLTGLSVSLSESDKTTTPLS